MAATRTPMQDRAARAAPQAQPDGTHVTDPSERRVRKPDTEDAAPTVGRSGDQGARAERPEEGASDRRQGKKPLVESTRAAKPPAETPKADALTRPSAAGHPAT